MLSAAVVGTVPALKATGRNVQQNIQRSAAGQSGMRFGGMSSALIVADVALSVAIVGAVAGAWDTELSGGMGIQADQYLYAELRIPPIETGSEGGTFDPQEFDARLAVAQKALGERLEAEPGTGALAVASVLPGMDHPTRRVEVDGASQDADFAGHRVRTASVALGFPDALEQPILSGRAFNSSDLGEDRFTVIVNANFVDRVMSSRNPIGKRVRYKGRNGQDPGPWHEIIGVVGALGMNTDNPSGDAGLYHPLAPGELHPMPFAVRVGDDPVAFTSRLRALANEADPTATISAAKPLSEVFSFMTTFNGWLSLGVLTLIGVLFTLSTLGVYALMSFAVAQRTREIGIRIALGAPWRSVVAAVARRALAQLGLGVILGITVAGWLLSQLQPGDVPTLTRAPLLIAFVAGVVVMALMGMLACIAPTLRALRVEPTEAL